MSHIQIAMFIIGGVLVLAGLVGIVPVMRHHDEEDDSQTSQMPLDTIMPLTLSMRTPLTPAPASIATPQAYQPPAEPALPASAPPSQPPAEPTPSSHIDFDAGVVEELFAELFSLRLAVDGLRAEVRALRQPLDASPPAEDHRSVAA